MKLLWVTVLVLLGGFLGGCASAPTGGSVQSPILTARPAGVVSGEQRTGVIGLSSGNAHAAAYVPPTIDLAAPAPLLVVLHGAGQRGRDLLEGFRREADARGIILLAPNARRQTWDLVTSYARGAEDGLAFGDDILTVDEMMGQVFSQYAIDPKRVAIAGLSDGASYALSVGINNADLFDGVIAIAPGLISSWPAGADVGVYIAHGEKDRILPVSISRDGIAPQLAASGVEVELEVFDGGHELREDVLKRALDWLAWGETAP